MTINLIPLCVATIELAEPYTVSQTMTIAEVKSVRIVGERVNGSMHGTAAADWLEISPQGYGTLDVRLTIKTDDDALIFVSYKGRIALDTMTIFAAPLFHSGDERYAWVNRIQAVSKGTFPEPSILQYDIYELT